MSVNWWSDPNWALVLVMIGIAIIGACWKLYIWRKSSDKSDASSISASNIDATVTDYEDISTSDNAQTLVGNIFHGDVQVTQDINGNPLKEVAGDSEEDRTEISG